MNILVWYQHDPFKIQGEIEQEEEERRKRNKRHYGNGHFSLIGTQHLTVERSKWSAPVQRSRWRALPHSTGENIKAAPKTGSQ